MATGQVLKIFTNTSALPGGPITYVSAVFGGSGFTDPTVTIELESWKWIYSDAELGIDEPNVDPSLPPTTIAGGFKMTNITVSGVGYLDARNGDVETQIQQLWGISEIADPAVTYGTYRGSALFAITYPTEGQCKFIKLEIDENSSISEPATAVSGANSKPFRAKVTFTIRKMLRSQ